MLLNFLVENKTPGTVPLDQFLGRALRALRTQLGVETAFISQYTDGGPAVVMQADSASGALLPGAHDVAEASPLDEGPPQHERLSAPIRLADGTPYGRLVCVGRRPAQPFNGRDMTLLRVYAELAAEHIEAAESLGSKSEQIAGSIRTVIAGDGLSCVYQPIFDVTCGRVIGVEALARFSSEPARSPDAWFADAARVGMEVELEHQVIAEALRSFPQLPASVSVAFNVTSTILLNARLERAFASVDLKRIVLEINEHMSIRQYDEISRVLAPLRCHGLRIAVDDAGRGIEGFRHILNLQPDIIKLHRTLVHKMDSDPARRALAGAVVQFGRDQRCDIIAEGVETAAELGALKAMGVTRMQGYFLRRPGPARDDRCAVRAAAARSRACGSRSLAACRTCTVTTRYSAIKRVRDAF